MSKIRIFFSCDSNSECTVNVTGNLSLPPCSYLIIFRECSPLGSSGQRTCFLMYLPSMRSGTLQKGRKLFVSRNSLQDPGKEKSQMKRNLIIPHNTNTGPNPALTEATGKPTIKFNDSTIMSTGCTGFMYVPIWNQLYTNTLWCTV